MMKTKLNITIEDGLLKMAKVYALKKHVSLSSLIEEYLKTVVYVSPRQKNILDMVDRLHPDPKIIAESHQKPSFYEGQKRKYGF